MKNNHLLVFMILAAVLVIFSACGNSSDASNGGEDTQSENQHSTQNVGDNQSNTNSVKIAANDGDTDTNANDTNNNEPNKEMSKNKPNQEKDTSGNNIKGMKQVYLKQLMKRKKKWKKSKTIWKTIRHTP